ncbi:MAG: DUF2513 domain-containing protein [Oscillospiraceae bacterium]|nr:DUF2513 domain-containing protein [Oscillospiraceae bacterium]
MRLDIDCVRDVLLYTEANIQNVGDSIDLDELTANLGYDEDMIFNVCERLHEMDFIEGSCEHSDNYEYVLCDIKEITFAGYEYLDKIRCKTVFDKVKNFVSDNEGELSLSLAGTLCEKALDLLLSKYLGIS